MDKLLKHALDGDAINFVDRLKGKLNSAYSDEHGKISKQVAADLTGTKVVEQDEDEDKKEPKDVLELRKKIEDAEADDDVEDDEVKELKLKLKKMLKKKGLKESSTDDAKGTLKAIIGFLKKNGEGKDAKEMLAMGNGMMKHVEKEGSFSPDQAKWIFNTSKAVLK
jgi:Mg/Co/Ni transporter MgtE